MKWMTRGLATVLMVAMAGISIAGPVNVNTADAATIAKELQGIGTSRAKAIVEWRGKHGSFDSVEDLQNVKGVGKKIIRMNQGNIRFEDPIEDPRAKSD